MQETKKTRDKDTGARRRRDDCAGASAARRQLRRETDRRTPRVSTGFLCSCNFGLIRMNSTVPQQDEIRHHEMNIYGAEDGAKRRPQAQAVKLPLM